MALQALARTVVVCVGMIGATLASSPSRAADDAAGFIDDLGKRAIQVLTSSEADADREQQFRALFDEGFDVPTISRFVLGPYWRSASDPQKDEFQKLFEAYIVHAYAVRFKDYSGQQMKILAARPEGDAAFLVQSQIAGPSGGPPIKVDWRVGKSEHGFKITDVIVEGISMAVTERQEFASVIQRGGGQLEALLKVLRERSGQG
jgi:phospholipid transport system substrate-binding protein